MFSSNGIAAGKIPNGQQVYTAPGSYSLVVPAGVTALSAVLVAGGGGGGYDDGGSGGNLRYKNNIPVTPGETLTIIVGAGGAGNNNWNASIGGVSQLKRGATVIFDTNSVIGTVATGGGNGGGGGGYYDAGNGCDNGGGGGGAGGYSGNGAPGNSGGAPAGGGGASGCYSTSSYYTWDATSPYAGESEGWNGTDGGGVGLYGQGASGAAWSQAGSTTPTAYTKNYGGGGAGGFSATTAARMYPGAVGGGGGARLIWGAGRSYPSTLTGDLS